MEYAGSLQKANTAKERYNKLQNKCSRKLQQVIDLIIQMFHVEVFK